METPFHLQPDHEKAKNREKMLALVLRKGFDSKEFWARKLPEAFGKNAGRNRSRA